MKRTKITLAGKIVIFALVLVVVLAATYFLGGFNFTKHHNSNNVQTQAVQTQTASTTSSNTSSTTNDKTINLVLSQKISWKPILDANGGLTTQPGSIYDKLGIKVNITLDDKPSTSSANFISNKANSLGYTVNGYSAFYKQFQDAKVDTVMSYITSYSDGTDGVIARGNINSVNDFVNHKIGVPDSSSDQTLILWLMLKSDLNQEQINQIKSNIIVYKSVKEASEAFFNGKVDIVGSREPYLTQAKNTSGTKVLFSTKSANNLVLDGIIFRKDFATKNPDVVSKFVDGALQSINTTNFNNLKIMPSFKNTNDSDFQQMMTQIKYADYTANNKYLGGMAQKLFEDMNSVWEMAGTQTVHNTADKAFDKSYLDKLSGKYTLNNNTNTTVSDTQKQQAQAQNNNDALLKKSATIEFQANSAQFVDPASAEKVLNDFVSIAQFLNGAIIQIEGNVADTGSGDDPAGRQLSSQRAKAIADYFQKQGIDPSRFVVIGNGTSKQVAPNNTPEGMQKNRRTDIFFKIVE